MNDAQETAQLLAAAGFDIFPCEKNGKLPVIKGFPERATRDPKQVEKWLGGNNAGRNYGVSTSRYGDGKALLVVDVDDKDGRTGSATILQLEMQGFELPRTFEQSTPSGGRHLIYWVDEAVKQSANAIGSGVDIRSRGGYIVGPGSSINGNSYTVIAGPEHIQRAPQWLIDRIGVADTRPAKAKEVLPGIDPDRAVSRARKYLTNEAPIGQAGDRNDTAFRVAARLKDFGCTPEQATELLHEWNETCEPPLDDGEVEHCVRSAYTYGKEPQGASAPEVKFQKVEQPEGAKAVGHPLDELNKEFAYVKSGSCILHDTRDHNGRPITQRMSVAEFRYWLANKQFQAGKRTVSLADAWMEYSNRRQYDAVVFAPERQLGPRFYNLWRGFKYKPAARANHPGLTMFLDHALRNVCNGDEKEFKWLMGYFAHMVQRPWEKPLVALVFQGGKGVGKNALIERVGELFGVHAIVADNDRYLLSNFNGHMESCILLVLDEASWAGDKRAEGRMKGLITGSQHNIEHKGKEAYQVENLLRLVIIGNEAWLVPASQDERRFAVFCVGEGNKQDRKFFHDMRTLLEKDGYPHLLRYLLDYDLTDIDVNQAPNNKALAMQKRHSASPVEQWWMDCLYENQLCGAGFDGAIPDAFCPRRLYAAFKVWALDRNIRARGPTVKEFKEFFTRAAPSLVFKKITETRRERGDMTYQFHNPGIDLLRADWDKYLGVENDWT